MNLRVTTIQPLGIVTVGAIHLMVVDVFQSGLKKLQLTIIVIISELTD